MNDADKLAKMIFLNFILDKDKIYFVRAMDFHKSCLKDEKNEEVKKIHKKATAYCVRGMLKGFIPDDVVKKGVNMDKAIDHFVSQDRNMSLDDTDLDKLLN